VQFRDASLNFFAVSSFRSPVDQMKIGRKTLSDPLRFGKNLLEARRKRRRHGNDLYCDG